MFTSLKYRILVAGAIVAGSLSGPAIVMHLTQPAAVGAAGVPPTAYNSANAGIEMAVPAGWTVSETPLGLRANAPTNAAAAPNQGDRVFTAIEIDRSDLYNAAIRNDGCCRDMERDPHTGQITVNKPLPPAPTPTTTPLDATNYATQVVASLPLNVGAQMIGTRTIGGEQAALVSGLPDYGVPSVTTFLKHKGVLYTIIAMGSTSLSPDEDAVLTSIRFTS